MDRLLGEVFGKVRDAGLQFVDRFLAFFGDHLSSVPGVRQISVLSAERVNHDVDGIVELGVQLLGIGIGPFLDVLFPLFWGPEFWKRQMCSVEVADCRIELAGLADLGQSLIAAVARFSRSSSRLIAAAPSRLVQILPARTDKSSDLGPPCYAERSSRASSMCEGVGCSGPGRSSEGREGCEARWAATSLCGG